MKSIVDINTKIVHYYDNGEAIAQAMITVNSVAPSIHIDSGEVKKTQQVDTDYYFCDVAGLRGLAKHFNELADTAEKESPEAKKGGNNE